MDWFQLTPNSTKHKRDLRRVDLYKHTTRERGKDLVCAPWISDNSSVNSHNAFWDGFKCCCCGERNMLKVMKNLDVTVSDKSLSLSLECVRVLMKRWVHETAGNSPSQDKPFLVPRLTRVLCLRHIRIPRISGQRRVLGLDHTTPTQRTAGSGRGGGEKSCWSTNTWASLTQ